MRFRVRRPFDWAGRKYESGDVIDIPEGHPRIAGMLQGNHIAYDASPEPTTAAKPVKQQEQEVIVIS